MIMGTQIPDEEILMEILTKLPVKSIFRFKCVLKSWKTLFSEPYFKRKHLNHAKNQLDSQKLLIRASSPGKNDLNFYCTSLSPNRVNDIHHVFPPTISELHSAYKIYCCCDALFLIGIWTGPNVLEPPSMLLLWNPTTSESILLPTLGSPKQESIYGLGYDSTSDDYKVLRIDEDRIASDEILALKNGSWREIYSTSNGRVDGGYSFMLHREYLPFVNGAFHWFSLIDIFALNISDETHRIIPLPKNVCLFPPPHKAEARIEVGISVLKGMLCVFNNNEITFNLWIMKEYGVEESWTKLLTLPSNGATSVIPIYSFSDGKVLLRYNCGVYRSVIYRTSEDQIWAFDSDVIDPLSRFIMDGFVYTESLINPRNHQIE